MQAWVPRILPGSAVSRPPGGSVSPSRRSVSLSRIDAACRLRSARAGEWLYVFKPKVGQWIIYLKVAVRDDCIVVSFHESQEDHDDPA